MRKPTEITFVLNGKKTTATEGETIWQVAKRQNNHIPHLCYKDASGYRPDGNCRSCMVEVKGERVLAPSCLRKVTEGMEVTTDSSRAEASRKSVVELLLADQPPQAKAYERQSHFWHTTTQVGLTESRYPTRSKQPEADMSHPSMAVQLDACIHCNLCVRACREVQVNDVIGMAYRGAGSKIVFDFDDPMGDSTCVACGECVQACPTGALMEKSLLDENGEGAIEPDKEVDSLCPYCGVGCQLTFKVKDEKLIAVDGREGPANKNRLCVKGRFGFDYIHHPHRLTTPLIRTKPKDATERLDPANPYTHFRKASWDEALSLAADGFTKMLGESKANGQANNLAGFGCAKGSNEEAYLFQKLVRVGFGNNNVDHCTRLCHASSVTALTQTIGSGSVTSPVSEIKNAEVALIIGARPCQNHPVAATFIKNAAKNGTKLIIADPRGNELDRYAALTLNQKGGSDVALLNAMLNVIITEGLADEAYIKTHTQGYEQLKAHVKDFTPEEMSPVCGVPAKTIRTAARLFGKAKTAMIFWGMGISQHIHGTDNSRCLISLALATGNVGRKGTGLHPLRGQNNVQGASDAGLIPMVFPDYRPIEDPTAHKFFEDFWQTKLDPKQGLTVVEIMDAIDHKKIKGLYIMGENPAMSDPDVAHARKAMAKLEHMVVQDLFLTETAYLADVVLPSSALPEKTGSFTNTDRMVQLARKAVKMPEECRQDWWIIQQLANRLGLSWNYQDEGEIFEEMRQCMPSIKGITWERLQQQGSVTYPCEDADDPGQEVIFGEGFPTEDGKGKMVPASVIAPAEVPDETYPLMLTTGRLLEHWHTGAMTRRATNLDAIEPMPFIHLSGKDITNLGITENTTVTLETRRGKLEAKVRRDPQVSEGMVFMPFCFEDAAANLLTNDALDPYGKIPEFKFCAARITVNG